MAEIYDVKNREIAILQRKMIYFDEIWYINAYLEHGDSHVNKCENFQN